MIILIELTTLLQRLKSVSYSIFELNKDDDCVQIILKNGDQETKFVIVDPVSEDKYLELKTFLTNYTKI